MTERFVPPDSLTDYYRGETDSPVARDPSLFDFPCSADWRDFYASYHGGEIDFEVSPLYARWYRSIGLMPPLPEDESEQVESTPVDEHDWLKIGMALARAFRSKPPSEIKGVLR